MAATDVITLQAAKQALSIAQTDSRLDDVLATVITSVSQRLDDLCGPIVQRTVTGEVHDAPCGCELALRLWPVASVTTVKVWGSGAATTLTAETLAVAGGYLAEPTRRVDPDRTTARLSRVIRRRGSWTDEAWDAGSRIEVDYVAGRYANTAAVASSRFEMAAMLTLKSAWRFVEQSAVQVAPGEFVLPAGYFPGFAVPDAALEFVGQDRQNVVGIA